ncbi:MAG: LuxR C-terminal-related transcriptional regulator [Aureliella sp.]
MLTRSPIVNVFVFDSQIETSQIWQELASAYGFRINVFHNSEHLNSLAGEAQALVVDQSVLPHTLLSSVSTICRQHPRVQVIVTGKAINIDDAVDLMKDGAAMVFPKPLMRQRIMNSIPQLLQRVQQLSDMNTDYEYLHGRFSKLTTREKDVLNYILTGTSNKDTAQLLNVSVRTIESRRAKVYRKLDANNVAELVRKIDRLDSLSKGLGLQPQLRAKLERAPTPRLNGQPSNQVPFNSPHRVPQPIPAASYTRV